MKKQFTALLLMPEDLLLVVMTKIKKISVCKTRLVSKYFDTVQFQLTRCFIPVACFACCTLGNTS